MTNAQMLSLYSTIVTTLFTLFAAVLGWLGTRLYAKLDEMSKSLRTIEGDLHERITNIDKRVVALESRCNFEHDRRIESDRRSNQ